MRVLIHTFYKSILYSLLICGLSISSQVVFADEQVTTQANETLKLQKEQLSAQHTKSTGGLSNPTNHDTNEKETKPEIAYSNRSLRHTLVDSWIHNATFEYLLDNDGDGYYHRFRVTFDADTHFISDRIYAKLYLENDTEERLYYVTDDFTIVGQSLSDSYEVTTSLTEHYDSDQYNIRIAIFDANTHELLDSLNAHDDEDLYGRYLEEVSEDAHHTPIYTVQELTVALSGDNDHDGFFPNLDITVDADVSIGEEWVSISIYIIDPQGESTMLDRNDRVLISSYHTSDRATTNVILDSGYPSGSYHISAELRNADTGILLATADTTRNAGLPIESLDYEDIYSENHEHLQEEHYDSYGAVSHGHGGSLNAFWLLATLGFLGFRRLHNQLT